MASTLRISQPHSFSAVSHHRGVPRARPTSVFLLPKGPSAFRSCVLRRHSSAGRVSLVVFSTASTKTDMPRRKKPEAAKGFVEEMRAVAMRLHTRDQAREGEKETDGQPLAMWEPSILGYLRFLVDSKLVYDTLESIVHKATYLSYAEFRNTGLERSDELAKDLDWFKEQGHAIPEPSFPGTFYARYLEELSERDPQAFICHFYNIYFAHTAGGRMIGKKSLHSEGQIGCSILGTLTYSELYLTKKGDKVAEKILNKKELEFYKWDGDLSQLLQNVREKLNQVASSWSREEKDHCLEETEKSFKYSGDILRLILS